MCICFYVFHAFVCIGFYSCIPFKLMTLALSAPQFSNLQENVLFTVQALERTALTHLHSRNTPLLCFSPAGQRWNVQQMSF